MKYVFKCLSCGSFEVEQRITETTCTHPCPTCGHESFKVIQLSPVHFAGGDWASKGPVRKIKDPIGRDWQERRNKEKMF